MLKKRDRRSFKLEEALTSPKVARPSRLKNGELWRVAVKVIDPRGNEGLRVVEMK